MRIETKDRWKSVELRELESGECFSFDGRYYMKTDIDDSASIKVVALDTGFIHKFGAKTEVISIDAKVVIE